MSDAEPAFATVSFDDLRLLVENFGRTEAAIFADPKVPNYGNVVTALNRLRNYIASERFAHLSRSESERETMKAVREMNLEAGLREVEPGHFVLPGETYYTNAGQYRKA